MMLTVFSQIVQRAPPWVWLILAVLCVAGYVQTKTRTLSANRLKIVPAIMLPYSLFTTVSLFSNDIGMALAAWAVGALVGWLVSPKLFAGIATVNNAGTSAKAYTVQGSYTPWALMMIIFSVRFVHGMLRSVQPEWITTTMFVATIAIVLGLCSGLFAGRAWAALSSSK